MDLGTENKEPMQCQVCDRKDRRRKELEEGEPNGWLFHQLDFGDLSLQVLTCPQCNILNIHQIFEGYKKRIYSGKDFRYH